MVREPKNQFYGERSGTIRDPFGYDWMIGHEVEKVEPEEMQRRYTAISRPVAALLAHRDDDELRMSRY